MKALFAAAALLALSSTSAAAWDYSRITGPWICVHRCGGYLGRLGFIAPRGDGIVATSPTGRSSRGWFDYQDRLWFDDVRLGARVVDGGLAIQFDNGTVWVRPRQ